MAIVWPTERDVDSYASAGRGVVVPRPDCPGCRRPMRFWGWYERDVRVTASVIRRLWVRRARCCGRGHAVLPGFFAGGRLGGGGGGGSAGGGGGAGGGGRGG